MCGRYQLKDPDAADRLTRELFGAALFAVARFNVAPSQSMPVVSMGDEGPRCSDMRWGLVPFWEKSEKPKLAPINARSEEALGKPMFRQALQKRRCLIPADGFYEWKKLAGDVKQPFSIGLTGGRPFYFAGIYENATETRPETYALLTTGPNALMEDIHNRMPVIVDAVTARGWIEPGALSAQRLAAVATPYPAGEMEAFPVSRLVNNPRNEGPSLLDPAN